MMSCVLRNSGLSSIKFLCATLSHMSIRAGVVIAVSLKQIDNAPDTKSGSQCDNKGLQYIYCAVEKFHEILLSCRDSGCPKKGIKNGGQF